MPVSADQQSRRERYVDAAVRGELDKLASMQPGSGRNAGLNNAALALGGFVAAGALDESTAFELLYQACETNGYLRHDGAGQVRATIKSGLRKGMQEPRELPQENTAAVASVSPVGVTIAELRDAKKLKLERWREVSYRGRSAVAVDFLDLTGKVYATKLRLSLNGKPKYIYNPPLNGKPQIPYLPDGGKLAREKGYALVVEGESDQETATELGEPCIGLCGTGGPSSLQLEHIGGLHLYVLEENDDGGGKVFVEGVLRRVKELGHDKPVHVVKTPDAAKDINTLWQRLQDADVFRAKLHRAMQESEKTQEPQKYAAYNSVAITGRDKILALARTPVEYVWQDIVVAGTIAMLVGPSGEGKSTLLFLIIAARLNLGGPVELLGRYISPADPKKLVVVIEAEHGDTSTARLLVNGLQRLNIDDQALNHVSFVARKSVTLGSSEWKDIQRMVADGLVSDIALDTLGRVAPGDANDEREQVAIFSELALTIEKTPVGVEKPIIWVVAHSRKGATGEGLDEIGGSMQRAAQVDTALFVKGTRDETKRVVSSTVKFLKLREPPAEYPVPVEFSIVPDGKGGSTLRVNGAALKDERPLTVRILEHLHVHGAQTKTALCRALSRSDSDIEAAITTLFQSHRILTTTTKVRGQERKAFDLREHSPDFSPDSRFSP